MFKGLLTEYDLSSDEEDVESAAEEEKEGAKHQTPGSVEEAQSTSSATEANSESPTCPLPGISQEMWQKFQELRKKKDEMKMMTVTKVPKRRKRRRHKKGTEAESEESADTRERQEEREKHWDGLKQYFGVNDRFHRPACSEPAPKSGLEKSIERAIAEGDIAKAEEMSDRLATRELAVKIAEAADCRDFVTRKQEEEAVRAQKRRKQIAWRFEAKKRWETKSNMGYM